MKKWGGEVNSILDADTEHSTFSAWYGTYAIVEKQHVVVLMNVPTYVTVVIPAQEFKRSMSKTLRAALMPLLENVQLSGEQIEQLLADCYTVQFTSTNDRSMVSRLNRVVRSVSWRIADRRSPHRINLEMLDELHKTGVPGANRDEEYQTPRELLLKALGLAPERGPQLDLVEVRIALADLEPEIWRSVLLRVTNDLHDLHLAIVGCMGWTGFHQHAFYRGQDLIENEFGVVLSDLFGDTERPLRYTYGLGDNWEHIITFGEVVQWSLTTRAHMVTGGERAAPPEDIGGASGYLEFLSAWSNPTHPMYNTYMSWRKEPFDPEAFDLEETQIHVNGMMQYG